MRNILKSFLLLFFVFLLSAVAAIADDTAYKKLSEDVEHILSLESFEKMEKWLNEPHSDYECERKEDSDKLECRQKEQANSKTNYRIAADNTEKTISLSYTVDKDAKNKEAIKKAYDELIEFINNYYDNYELKDELKITEDEWVSIVDYIHFLNRKSTSFSYWLIGDNIVFSSLKESKYSYSVSICICDSIIFLDQAEKSAYVLK